MFSPLSSVCVAARLKRVPHPVTMEEDGLETTRHCARGHNEKQISAIQMPDYRDTVM